MTAEVIVVDPLMKDEEADAILELWRRFPSYGLYSNEGYEMNFAPELAQHWLPGQAPTADERVESANDDLSLGEQVALEELADRVSAARCIY